MLETPPVDFPENAQPEPGIENRNSNLLSPDTVLLSASLMEHVAHDAPIDAQQVETLVFSVSSDFSHAGIPLQEKEKKDVLSRAKRWFSKSAKKAFGPAGEPDSETGEDIDLSEYVTALKNVQSIYVSADTQKRFNSLTG